jgi:hypothetical protein
MKTQARADSAVEQQPERAAPSPSWRVTRGQPCPEKIWWFGVLVGAPLMIAGFTLILTFFGAPVGIPMWAAGLGLMLSSRPCKE